MAGLGIHGVELAAGIGGLEHRDVVGTSSNGMRKTGNGRVTGTRRVHSRNRGRLGAERAALMEAHRTGSAHRNDNPGDTGKTVIGGKRVFDVAEGFLLACFDEGVTMETVTAIARRQPYYAVFRDSGMQNDSVATNFDQIFETYSPSTVRKVL